MRDFLKLFLELFLKLLRFRPNFSALFFLIFKKLEFFTRKVVCKFFFLVIMKLGMGLGLLQNDSWKKGLEEVILVSKMRCKNLMRIESW